MADRHDEDPFADTGVFQAFMDAGEEETTRYSTVYRVVALVVVLALVVSTVFLLFL